MLLTLCAVPFLVPFFASVVALPHPKATPGYQGAFQGPVAARAANTAFRRPVTPDIASPSAPTPTVNKLFVMDGEESMGEDPSGCTDLSSDIIEKRCKESDSPSRDRPTDCTDCRKSSLEDRPIDCIGCRESSLEDQPMDCIDCRNPSLEVEPTACINCENPLLEDQPTDCVTCGNSSFEERPTDCSTRDCPTTCTTNAQATVTVTETILINAEETGVAGGNDLRKRTQGKKNPKKTSSNQNKVAARDGSAKSGASTPKLSPKGGAPGRPNTV